MQQDLGSSRNEADVTQEMSPEAQPGSGDDPIDMRIMAIFPELTPSEKRLAEVVLEAQSTLSSYTAAELAESAGISSATAARFFKRLGYRNYNEARLHSRLGLDSGDGWVPSYLKACMLAPCLLQSFPGGAGMCFSSIVQT